MNKRLIGYGVLFFVVVVFGLLWWKLGDPVGALLSLIVLSLGIGLLLAIVSYFAESFPGWLRRVRKVSWEDHVERLEAEGKAARNEYQAIGAVSVEDLNTGSLMHFIDIGEGRILCLFGQYYYEFEPIDDDSDLNQPRRFPTKQFALLRSVKNDEVLGLFPGPEVFEPIVFDPIVKLEKLFDMGFELKDGEIVTDTSLDAVKRAVAAAK